MNVKEAMNTEVITCKPGDPVGKLVELLKKHHISGMPVVDNEKVVGIVSETDMLKLFQTPEVSSDMFLPSPFEIIEMPIRSVIRFEEFKKSLEDIRMKPVRDIMKKKIYSVSPDISLEEASGMMVKYDVNRLPVIENGKLIGILVRSDIIRGLSKE
ncbi:MAG: CBS domain-containing protein [Euryarchaeota archaeon]|nr:CBS domain-containing protein [Euryarchaeota archaeon]MBU4140001.1 CBS domain-containing protein [Euryarchaeota archaeon]